MILWLALLASAPAQSAAARVAVHRVAAPRMRKARDPEIAVCEEFAAARAAHTVAALDLFIARHPGHRLVKAARQERDELARRPLHK